MSTVRQRLAGKTLAEKLLMNHRKEGACWRWTGAHTPTGYGHLSVEGRARGVHRVAYEVFVGPIPEGLDIDHACNIRDCINPEHLRPMTHRENLLRSTGISGAASRATHCPQGHPYDNENTQIGTSGWRHCRPCKRAHNRAYRAAKRDAALIAKTAAQTPATSPEEGR